MEAKSQKIHKLKSLLRKKLYKRFYNYYFNVLTENELYINTGIVGLSDEHFKLLNIAELEYHAKKFLNHQFNYLGTGWLKHGYSVSPIGFNSIIYNNTLNINKFDNKGNWLQELLPRRVYKRSKNAWRLIHDNYDPIDWQLDIKTGYRWNNACWSGLIKPAPNYGVDIKNPWELSRMQHFPKMAIIASTLDNYRQELLKEFKSQVLDFIVTNPVFYGVNWYNAMEAGIRISNILVAYDLFKQIDTNNILDKSFLTVLSNSVYHHGVFIWNNLEFSGNHYLANLTGLIFISNYLQGKKKVTNKWIKFGLKEIFIEINKQFHHDGGHYESSTYYHKLSLELVLYSLALLARNGFLTKSFNSKDINDSLERINKAILLLRDLRKADGSMPQFGDNDSGRLFSIIPYGRFITNEAAEKLYINLKGYTKAVSRYSSENELYWDEDYLFVDPVLNAGKALFDSDKKPDRIEEGFILSLSKGNHLYSNTKEKVKTNSFDYLNGLHFSFKRKTIFNSSVNLRKNLSHYFYFDTGYYIFKSDFLYIAFNGNDVGKKGGHSHNDKLSYELIINGKTICKDRGTFIYTADKEYRDAFRSDNAHNIIHVEKNQNEFISFFKARKDSNCYLIGYKENEIILGLDFKGVNQARHIIINNDSVIIDDYSSEKILNTSDFKYFSNGYGQIQVMK